MFAEIVSDEFTAALDACAADILWETGITEPPIDAALVAQRLGLCVTENESMSHRGRFVRLADEYGRAAGQGTIVIGPAERPERREWAIAHEIGESVSYRVFANLGIRADTAPHDAREEVANHLATCLLLPRPWFHRDGQQNNWDLAVLKVRYATASHELIARRMLEMPPAIVITICDQGRVHWRRSNQPARPPRLLPQELDVWREAHEFGEPASAVLDPTATGLESVRAWPIHEPSWKREILRSEIAEW